MSRGHPRGGGTAPGGFDPLRELAAVQDRMNRLFETALTRTNFDPQGGVGSWLPVADAWENDDSILFAVELPGLTLSQIDVRVEEDELVVEGERRMERERPGEHYHRVEGSYGKFARRFALPSVADRQAASASLCDGVLRVRFPKSAERPSGPIRLPIR